MATTPTYTFSPLPSIHLQHSEGVVSTYTFRISTAAVGATQPRVTRIELSNNKLRQLATSSINLDGSGTVNITTAPVYSWTLYFKQLVTHTIFTQDNSWYSPPDSTVFRYIKHLDNPNFTIDVYGSVPDPNAVVVVGGPVTPELKFHEQYIVDATPDFSAGKVQLKELVRQSPV